MSTLPILEHTTSRAETFIFTGSLQSVRGWLLYTRSLEVVRTSLLFMTLLRLAVSLVPRPSVNVDLLTEGLGTRLAGGKKELTPFYRASVKSYTQSCTQTLSPMIPVRRVWQLMH